jgi:hypothetical protein
MTSSMPSNTGIKFRRLDNLFAAIPPTRKVDGIIRAFEGRADKPPFTVLCRADQFAERQVTPGNDDPAGWPGGSTTSPRIESISTRSLIQMRKKSDLPPITRLRNACEWGSTETATRTS